MYTFATMLQFATLAILLAIAILATRKVVLNDGLKGIFAKRRPRYARTTNK